MKPNNGCASGGVYDTWNNMYNNTSGVIGQKFSLQTQTYIAKNIPLHYITDEDVEYFYQMVELSRKIMASIGLQTKDLKLHVDPEKCEVTFRTTLYKKPEDADKFVSKMKRAFIKGAIDEQNSDKNSNQNRKTKFFDVLDTYLTNIDYTFNNVSFLLTLDSDDSDMNSDDVEKRVKFLTNIYDTPITRYYGLSNNKIHAVNRDMDVYIAPWDILVLSSDDMIPVKYGFNKIISDDMDANFPNLDGSLYYPDGYTPLNTLPIIGKPYYKRFNYIYNPLYKSFFCDNEFHNVGLALKKMVKINTILFKHDHPQNNVGVPWDVLYQKNNNSWDEDQKLFNERTTINYGLKKEEVK